MSSTTRVPSFSSVVVGAALVVALTAGGTGAAKKRPVPAADNAPVGHLCGLAAPVDTVFGCVASVEPPSRSDEPPTTGGADEDVRETPVAPQYVPNRLVVTFRKGTPKATISAILARAGVKLERTIAKIGAHVVRVSPERLAEALASLNASRQVETAQRDVVVEAFDTIPNDAHWPAQWGLHATGLAQAWDTTRGLGSVVVAVIDTGVDPNHADLQGALLPGVDFVNADADASDDHGHGTAVAGVVAARTNNLEGQAGVCWKCSVLPLKALDASGRGTTSMIAGAIVRAVDLGARVINLSLGAPATTGALEDAVSYALRKDVVVVAAAGNSGTDTQFYPAAYAGVVSVAASDAAGSLYAWSNRGEWVGFAAPGCLVAPAAGGGYATFCGTSSATPLVAGLAALAFSARHDATAEAIRGALERAAAPMPGAVRHGRVQAPATVSALGAEPQAAILRGRLTSRIGARTYRRVVGPGPLTARLGFPGTRRLTLSVLGSSGVRVARRSGQSPVRLTIRLRAGSYRFVVGGVKLRRVDFVLLLSHAPPRLGT